MDLDYIIVRRKIAAGNFQAGADIVLEDALGGAAAAGDDLAIGTILEVSTGKLDAQQAYEINQDPELTAFPDIPVTVIEPVAAADAGLPPDGDALAAAKTAGISWGIASVRADMTPRTGAGVKIAVLDTGIKKDHPAFNGIAFSADNCCNFIGGPADDVTDNFGHGTHCAGTIFGRDVDGMRIGVARGVQDVLIGKVLDDQGRGKASAVLEALWWAGRKGANIISLSLGFDFTAMVDRLVAQGTPSKAAVAITLIAYRETLKQFESQLDSLKLENAMSRGTVVVAATGNDSRVNIDPKLVIGASMPAAATQDVLSVGAAMRGPNGKLRIAPFSNIHPRVSAPGVDIVSASHRGGLVAMNGTSMACPHVAGIAALHWQANLESNGAVNATDTRGSVIAAALASDFETSVPPAHRGRGNVRAPA